MAATTGLPSAILGPLAPPLASTGAPPTAAAATAATSSTVKSMKQLMDEIDQAKIDFENTIKPLEKIETGRKKTVSSHDQAVQGRTKIREFNERVLSLQNQITAMTKETDPTYDKNLFDKTKKNGQKSLTDLSHKIDRVDKHLEKATGKTSTTTAPSAGTHSTPPVVSTAVTEGENTKGTGSILNRLPFIGKKAASKVPVATTTPETVPTPAKPADEAGDAARKTTNDKAASDDDDEEEEVEEEEESDDDDDDVISDKKKVPEKSPRLTKNTEPIVTTRKKAAVTNVESDDSEYSDDEDDGDDDGANDQRQLLDALASRELTGETIKDPHSDGRRSGTPTTPRGDKKVPAIKTDSTISSSPKPKKTTTIPPPLPASRGRPPSPKRRTRVPPPEKKVEESEDDSYSGVEEDDEEEEEELRRLRDTGDREEPESDHDYDAPEEEEEPAIANAHVQELRTNKHVPGTKFVVTHDLTGVQTGDLTIHRGEILTLIEQRPDDWWLFKNDQTQQQGVVPINHIQLSSGQRPRRRIKPSTSATTLVDAFKANNNIPVGFISSDLAPLAQLEEYQLWRALVPKMTESNLAFTDLHWRVDTDKLHVRDVAYQKILIIKECVKIPRVTGEQIRVLDRCVRVCLDDGFEIVSNIHTIRAHVPAKIDERELSENWTFLSNDIDTLIDEQSQLLLRSNRSKADQHLHLLIELSQWCQSTVTQEKCEIACGWSRIPLEDHKPPLLTDTKSYNELLHGGHTDDPNVLLDPQYKILRSDGLSGMIDRFKRARIKFSIESRETDVDLLYDNLPIQPIIVPMNLIKTLAFFRNELAFQLHKRLHPTGLSTTPIDSLFLSTFFKTLEQPDLIYTLRRLYRSRKKRFLHSSSSSQQQREEFIKTYEIFIYPLIHYRQLPAYDFHDITALNERRKLINDMVKRQLPAKKAPPQDILSILLDPNLTDKWTPFTTDEISFTLQKYIHDFQPDIVA